LFGDSDHQKWDYRWNRIIDALYDTPEIRAMYFRRLRTLMDKFLAPGLYESQVAAIIPLIAPEAEADRLKWGQYGASQTLVQATDLIVGDYLPRRRAHLFTTHRLDDEIPPAASANPAVIISEIMYHPLGEASTEFVELYNPSSSESVDLSGWQLQGVELTLSPGTVLLPDSFLVVVQNDVMFRATYRSGVFIAAQYTGSLDDAGASLTLLNDRWEVVDAVAYDSVAPWPQTPAGGGRSLERISTDQDGSRPANWAASLVFGGTPGAPNSMAGMTAPVPPVWVNEMVAVNATGLSDEQGERAPWIELYNSSDGPVNLGGMYLTDDYGQPAKWPIPGGTPLNGKSWLVIWADGEPGEGPLHTSFSLSAANGHVGLYTAGGTIIDYLNYDPLPADTAYGKYPDGTSVRRVFSTPTPGGANRIDTAAVILNEYNAVKAENYLKDLGTDLFLGRVLGNGGNWFELVVTEDHADLRGWRLVWTEAPSDTGTLALTQHLLWSDLRAGTIITFGESDTAAGGLDTDTSYDPSGGDWWIHINTLSGGVPQETYVTTTTNVPGDGPGHFSVGNDNWQVTIRDSQERLVFGPAGEGVQPTSGIGNDEVFKLEEDPSPSIRPTSAYNDGTSSSFGHPNLWAGGTIQQDFSALRDVFGDCQSSATCDDGLFCNGLEQCVEGSCQAGSNPCPGQTCDEITDTCVSGCITDAECDDGAYCNGAEWCDAGTCVGGTAPCGSVCEQCSEEAESCVWCQMDLDGNGFIGPGEFGFFAGCFGRSYAVGEPCRLCNFDGSADGFVGPGDFGGFAGCFGGGCTACANCWPGRGGKRSSAGAAAVEVVLVPVGAPTARDVVSSLPARQGRFTVGSPAWVEMWARVGREGAVLAGVYAEVSVQSEVIGIREIEPSEALGLFALAEVVRPWVQDLSDQRPPLAGPPQEWPDGGFQPSAGPSAGASGRLSAMPGQIYVGQAIALSPVVEMGGCAPLGEEALGAGGAWVRVGVLQLGSRRPGTAHLSAQPAGGGYGVALRGELGLLAGCEVQYGECDLRFALPTPVETSEVRRRN
jgi:hypothetical protein